MLLPDLEILLPVHNEADSIEATLREIYQELSPKLPIRFIVCEDGSSDNTKEVLQQLAGELPLRLNLSDARKGYSRAVREGMQMLESPYLLCLDADGQCDPKNFWSFWEARKGADIVFGWRVKRADSLIRRTLSAVFKVFYMAVLRPPVHDPSCPYVLMTSRVAAELSPELGVMRQGFWWEFIARAHRRGYTIKELPVDHRKRLAGATQVYRWQTMPGIFLRHLAAIFTIWSQTRIPVPLARGENANRSAAPHTPATLDSNSD